MRVLVALVLGVLAAGSASADTMHERYFRSLFAHRQPGSPQRCIVPDLTAQPVILDGRAIAYFGANKIYLNRFGKHGCPQLMQNRTVITKGAGSQLCRNDPVRVADAGSGFGFCTLDDFVPYTKTK